MAMTDDIDAPAPFAGPAWLGYGAGLAMVALVTVLAVLVDAQAHTPNLSLMFVLPVVIAAVNWGWGPSLASAAGAVMAYNFFLIEPRYTLRVSDTSNVWALALLSAVAIIVSAVAAQSRRRAIAAQQRALEYEALQRLARSLVGASGRGEILRAAADALGGVFRAPATVLFDDDGLLTAAPGHAVAAADLEAARWALASRLPARAGAYPVGEGRYDFWPVVTPSRLQAVIGVDLGGRVRPADPERLVEIIGGYLAVALERDAFAAGVLRARLAEQGERVKSDLLAAVSHDLRTPLSTILFTLQSLRAYGEAHEPTTRDQLLASAEAETARLAGMVSNLLDMSRVESGALKAEPVLLAPGELVDDVLQRLAGALAGHLVVNGVDPVLPRVLADRALAEAALANVLENAAKYSPVGGAIEIRAAEIGGVMAIDVLDQGPGFPGPTEPLFEKFARGVEGDGRPPGTGLGLAIARGYLAAQGGTIEAANRADGPGARVRLLLPLAPAEAAG